jgi:hypothetical protein
MGIGAHSGDSRGRLSGGTAAAAEPVPGRRAGGGAEIAWRGWLRVYMAAKIVGKAVMNSLSRRGCR